jgi:hypothetical protein
VLDNSNTLLLERQFGWRGILAEPLPSEAGRCASNRTAIVDPRCVWSVSGERLEFNPVPGVEQLATLKMFEGGDLHAARRRESAAWIEVLTVSLNDLLAQHHAPGVIDFMSVDTEGSELPILESFDFDRWHVGIMSVEHNWTPLRGPIQDLLARHGLIRVERTVDHCDDLFVQAREFPAFAR